MLRAPGAVSASELGAWASWAEHAGFSPLWVDDGPEDAVVVLGALARLTTVASIGATFDLSRRPVPVLAKMLATIDVLSRGRLVIGLRSPVAVFEEVLEVLEGMFTGEPFEHGGTIPVRGARCRPLPAQRPRPPVVQVHELDTAQQWSPPELSGLRTGHVVVAPGVLEPTRWLASWESSGVPTLVVRPSAVPLGASDPMTALHPSASARPRD